LLTLLSLSRTLDLSQKEKLKLIPDYESITKPSSMNYIIPTGFIKIFVENFKMKSEQPKFDIKNVYLSNKAGPEGKTTLNCFKSLFSFSYPLMAMIFKITDNSGIDYFTSQYRYNFNNNPENGKLGKLSFIYDPECKLRIVAIVDYYTQLFLKPIHERIMFLLNNIPNDRTYTQNPFHD